MAGPSFGLKRAIDSGVNPGPRIWPSGAIGTIGDGSAADGAAMREPRVHRCGNVMRETEIAVAGGLRDHRPVLIRSRFIENASTISFLLPCIQGDVARLNGKEVDARYLASSNGGVKHQFLTKGPHEVGAFTADRDVLFVAIEVLGKHAVPAYLHHDATILTDPRCTAKLNVLYRQVNCVLRTLSRQNLSAFAGHGIAILRDGVLAELVSSITEGQGKRDHLATWRRTEAMARIDRFVDEYADQIFSLECFCLETGMSLRTLEAIIKERTGLSALSYLRRRRLAMVRQALLNPDDTTNVTRTALRYGFLHLGRFSVEYRRTYGETPSETLSQKLGNSLASP